MSADELIARGELEEAAADPESASAALAEAARHVGSASEVEDAIEIAARLVEICREDV